MRTTRKLAPRSSVPILKTDNAVIQGSTEIINFLEQSFPDRSLTPPDPQDANSARAWEKYLDDEIGVTLRLWFYYHTLPDRDRALRFLCSDATWLQRSVFALSFAAIRGKMIQFMNINAETASSAEQRFALAFDRLDQSLERGPFLVGKRFPGLTCLRARCFGLCAGRANPSPKSKRSFVQQSARFANSSSIDPSIVGCSSDTRRIERLDVRT